MIKKIGIQPFIIGAVSLAGFLLVLVIARLFQGTFRFLAWRLRHYVPPKVSSLIGLIAAFLLFWSVVDGVLFSVILRSTDASYQQVDALMGPDNMKPADPMKTGSTESLIPWEDLGREGRRFVTGGPTSTELNAFLGESVTDPIRVYVGLHVGESFEEPSDRCFVTQMPPLSGLWRGPTCVAPVRKPGVESRNRFRP